MPFNEQNAPDLSVTPREVRQDTIKRLVETLFENDKTRQRLTDAILRSDEIRRRPTQWKGASNAPYYKERFALELKVNVDDMIADGENRMYRYSEFRDYTPTSLYLKINQSFRYLIDYLDTPDHKYRIFRECVSITKHKGQGILISFNKDIRKGGDDKFIPTKVDRNGSAWRAEMDDFLENASEGHCFYRDKLMLTSDEVEELRMSLDALEGIVANVKTTSIKIVKT